MSIKKTLLLAMSALALIAFAVPATASAVPGKIVDVNGDIDEHLEVHVVVHGEFETLGSGIRCTIDGTLTTTDGTTATTRLTNPVVTTNTCEYFGLYAGCELAEDEATGAPWVVHPDANTPEEQDSLTITDVTFDGTFKPSEECLFETTDLSFPHIHINVDDPITGGVLTEPDPETGTNEGTATGFFAGEEPEPFELPVAAAGTATLGEWTDTKGNKGAATGTFRIVPAE